MSEVTNVDSTRDESADPCCAEHIAAVAERLQYWSEAIVLAKEKGCLQVSVVGTATQEIASILETSCERLKASQSVYGEASSDAKEVVIEREVFSGFEFEVHAGNCECNICRMVRSDTLKQMLASRLT